MEDTVPIGDEAARRLEKAEVNSVRALALASETRSRVDTINTDIATMTRELRTFTESVARLTILTETRHHSYVLEQRLKEEFGLYDRVRRHANTVLGYLEQPAPRRAWMNKAQDELDQASDCFWLAPAVTALSLWLDDEREKAAKAREQALHLSPARTSLFFAVVCRMLSRRGACVEWLGRFFDNCDFGHMSAIDAGAFFAAATGTFGSEGWELARSRCRSMISSLDKSRPDDSADLKWDDFFSRRGEAAEPELFSSLRSHAANRMAIEESLTEASRMDGVRAFYVAVASPDGPAAEPRDARSLMRGLIDEFLPGEAPLRRELRQMRIVIEEKADMEAAAARLEREWPVAETEATFPHFLATAAADGLNGSAPRRLALGLSRPWLEGAHERLTARLRLYTPGQIQVCSDDWTGNTANGENGSDLLASFSRHYEEAAKGPPKRTAWQDENLLVAAGVTLVFTLVTVTTIILPLLAIGAFAWYFNLRSKTWDKQKIDDAEQVAEARRLRMDSLSAAINEVGAYRRHLAVKSREFAEALSIVRGIEEDATPPAFPKIWDSSPDAASHAETPAWDL